MKMISVLLVGFGVLSAQAPQAPNLTQQSGTSENAARMAVASVPIYRVTVVERTTKAVNYHNRGGATKSTFAARRSWQRPTVRLKPRANRATSRLKWNFANFSQQPHTGPNT
jgi:hypothetical protein